MLSKLIHTLGIKPLMPVFPLSTQEFTQLFANKLQAQLPVTEANITDALRITCKYGDGQEGTLFLDNAYSHYVKYPREFAEVLRVYIQSFEETTTAEKEDIDASRIVPVIKDKAWLEEIRANVPEDKQDNMPGGVREDLNDALLIIYAEDTPSNINYFTQKDFAKLDIPAAQIRALAVPNLRRLLPKPEVHWNEHTGMITAGGDYEASLMLFDELWDSLKKADAEIVAAIPARDLLLFTYSNDAAGIAQLREMTDKFYNEASYYLTDKLFVYRSGKFEVFAGNY